MTAAMHLAPIPFITLPNWVKAAARCGFNIEPLFREAGIATDLIHIETATVQPELLDEVMSACVAISAEQHFPFVLGETFAFDYLPDLETFVTTSPTLRDAVRVFDWVRELINPMIDVRLVEADAQARLIIDLGGDGMPGGKPYFVETMFATVLKFARALVRPAPPFELCFRYPAPAHAQRYHDYFAAPVFFDAPEHMLRFPREMLDGGLEGAFPALHRQAEYRVEQRLARSAPKPGLVAAIEQAFATRPALLGQGVERVAEALGLQVRTLQRRLREEDQRYADVQDRARFSLATRWLNDGDLDIETISERLGFSDRRSFTRAFTRWSGLSPSAFRGKNKVS